MFDINFFFASALLIRVPCWCSHHNKTKIEIESNKGHHSKIKNSTFLINLKSADCHMWWLETYYDRDSCIWWDCSNFVSTENFLFCINNYSFCSSFCRIIIKLPVSEICVHSRRCNYCTDPGFMISNKSVSCVRLVSLYLHSIVVVQREIC